MKSVSSPAAGGLVEALLKRQEERIQNPRTLLGEFFQGTVHENDLELVRTYFASSGDINPTNFFRSYNGSCLTIESLSHNKGYCFFPEFPFGNNHKVRMETSLSMQEYLGRKVGREFTDHDGKISGFSWRKS